MTDDKDIQELLCRKERAISSMGGPEKIAAQHGRGRLTARERILIKVGMRGERSVPILCSLVQRVHLKIVRWT